jgi:anaerobic selenocysteine-containing dehydrogenase
MGLTGEAFEEDDVTIIRQALWEGREGSVPPSMQGLSFDRLHEHGWMRLNLGTPYAPFAEGGFATPSGKCELYSQLMADEGLDPLPTFTAPLEFPDAVPELAARYPLTLVSSPRHQFLNSTFVNVPSLSRNAEPECVIHPEDAARRGIETGTRVRLFNDRGAFAAVARVGDGIRPGVVWAPSIWWTKLAGDRRNANDTTSQRTTDMGRGPVFYDNLVEVAPVDGA